MHRFHTGYRADLLNRVNCPAAPLAIPMAGDRDAAKDVVATLAKKAGFDPVKVGGLACFADLDPGSRVDAKSMTAAEVRATLGIEP